MQKKLTTKDREVIGEQCLKETGMKRQMVVYYRDTQKFPKYDKTYMEFLNCSYKKQGYQTEEGDIIFENLKEFLEEFYTPEQVDIVLNPCKPLKGKNPGETAFYVMRCIIENLQLLEENMEKTD